MLHSCFILEYRLNLACCEPELAKYILLGGSELIYYVMHLINVKHTTTQYAFQTVGMIKPLLQKTIPAQAILSNT